jgi:hypothetical protein
VLGLKMEDTRLKWQYANNTLIVSYSKPQEVRAAESAERRGLSTIQAQSEASHTDVSESGCKQQ